MPLSVKSYCESGQGSVSAIPKARAVMLIGQVLVPLLYTAAKGAKLEIYLLFILHRNWPFHPRMAIIGQDPG